MSFGSPDDLGCCDKPKTKPELKPNGFSKLSVVMIVCGIACSFPLPICLSLANVLTAVQAKVMCGWGGATLVTGIVVAVLNGFLREE